MSSRVAVMNSGRIEQVDAPEKIFHAPASEFVYTFIGESCCLPVEVGPSGVADKSGALLPLHLGQSQPTGKSRLYVRPSRFRLAAEAAALPNRLRARVHFIEFLGDVYRYHLKAGALELAADHPGAIGVKAGEEIDVGWRNEDMSVFR